MNFFCESSDFVEKPVAALLLNADTVAGNAARQWLAGNSGKPARIFMLCEKKHKWICNHGRPQTGKTDVSPPRNLVLEPKTFTKSEDSN